MSLLRLLATGRSLVGMKDGISPYRMCTKNLLPNFGATRNPFVPQAKPEVPREPLCPKPAGSEPMSWFDAELKPAAHPGVKAEVLSALAQVDATEECKVPRTPTRNHLETEKAVNADLRPSARSFSMKEQPSFATAEKGRMVEAPVLPAALLTSCPTKPTVVEPRSSDEKPSDAVKPAEPPLVEKSPFAQEKPLVKMHPSRPPKPTGFSRWLAQISPWLQLGGWGKVGSKRPGRSRPPEQSEFLLAQIKPLRNELNDSDLQVVSTSVSQNEKSPGGSSGRNVGSVAAGPLNRLGKLLGADHVQAR